jgi:hypothetical protein
VLTGQGLIGKLVGFLATKLLGRRIDLALDERKRACRAFTELYYCLDRLEEITSIFLSEIDILLRETDDSKTAYWIINEFHNQSHSIESLSQRFFELGSELAWAIQLFDPTLAASVNQLYRFKYSFLYFISNSIEVKEKDGKPLQLLAYQEPSSKILSIDMDSYYDWVKENEGKSIERESVEWPINFLEFSEFETGYTEIVFGVDDIEGARKFCDIIRTHATALGDAREKLRQVLISNFKIDEVLYVSKGLPRDEF